MISLMKAIPQQESAPSTLTADEQTEWVGLFEEVSMLLGNPRPSRIVHELRNVLNERDVLCEFFDRTCPQDQES